MQRFLRRPTLLAALIAACGCEAQQIDCDPALGQLPVDLELIVAVDRPADLLSSDEGRGVIAFAEAFGLFEEATGQWNALANALGLSREAAAERLLGHRVLFVAESMDEEDSRWAILSEVEHDAAALLKKGLNAAPRGVVDGQPVLSIEDGRFELVTFRHRGDSFLTGEPNRTTLMLAPSGQPKLMERMLRSVRARNPEMLDDTGIVDEVCRLGPSSMVLLMRLRPPPPPPDQPHVNAGWRPPWTDFIIGSLAREPGGWDMRVIVRDWQLRQEMRPIEPWTDDAFRRLEHGTFAAIVEHGNVAGNTHLRDRLSPLSWLTASLNLPPAIDGQLAGRVALRVDEPNDDALRISLAVESGKDASFAKEADEFVVGRLHRVEREFGGGELQPIAPLGLAPDAVRSVGVDLGAAGRLTGMPETRLVWGYPRSASGRWWVVSGLVGEAGAPEASVRWPSTVFGHGVEQQAGEPLPRLSLGVVHPREFVNHLGALTGMEWMSGFAVAERVSWDFRLTEFTDVEGRIEIRFGDREDGDP